MATIKIRTRIYLAVEGDGEQSFVKLLQNFADQNNLFVHLDCKVLGGGGYKTMFREALQHRQRTNKLKNKAKSSILLVDGDRHERKEDGWSLAKLKQEAKKSDFQVCVQQPNQEGLLFRMLPGNETKKPSIANIHKLLLKQWPSYKKPIDFCVLVSKFRLDDLLRAAEVDSDLDNLLSTIGLYHSLKS